MLIVNFIKYWQIYGYLDWIIYHWYYCFLHHPYHWQQTQTHSETKSLKIYLKSLTIQLYLYNWEVQLVSHLSIFNLVALLIAPWKVLLCRSGLNLEESPDRVNVFIFYCRQVGHVFILKSQYAFSITKTNSHIRNYWKSALFYLDGQHAL